MNYGRTSWSCRPANVSSDKPAAEQPEEQEVNTRPVNTECNRHLRPDMDKAIKIPPINRVANAMPPANALVDLQDRRANPGNRASTVKTVWTVIRESMPKTAKWSNRKSCARNAHRDHPDRLDPTVHREPKE